MGVAVCVDRLLGAHLCMQLRLAPRTPPTASRGVLTAAGESGCQQGLYSVSGVLLKRSRSM